MTRNWWVPTPSDRTASSQLQPRTGMAKWPVHRQHWAGQKRTRRRGTKGMLSGGSGLCVLHAK